MHFSTFSKHFSQKIPGVFSHAKKKVTIIQLLLSGMLCALTALLSAKASQNLSFHQPYPCLPVTPPLLAESLFPPPVYSLIIKKQDHQALLTRRIHCNQGEEAFYKNQNRFPQNREKKVRTALISLKTGHVD